jgi:tetratricopeptide (TPR) repeat protein
MAKKGDKVLQMAQEYQGAGLYDMAAQAYRDAIDLFKEDEDFARQADALTSMGKMYDRLLCDHPRALENFQKSLRLRQIYGLKHLSEEYLNVAAQQNILGQLAVARDNLERGKHAAERAGNQCALGRIFNLMGDILMEQGYLDEAEDHLQSSLELLTAVGDDSLTSYVQSSIGLLLACRNKSNDAFHALQSALDQAEKISSDSAISTAQLRYGQAYWLQGNYSEARDHLQKALEMAERINVKILRETALEWLDRCGQNKLLRPGSPDDI